MLSWVKKIVLFHEGYHTIPQDLFQEFDEVRGQCHRSVVGCYTTTISLVDGDDVGHLHELWDLTTVS